MAIRQKCNLLDSVWAWGHSTFASLGVRNYRLFFTGQVISVCGSWVQRIAQSWLVLQLTGSGSALGLVTALQCLPIFVLAPYGGVLVDRFSKRRLLFATQGISAVLALILGALVATGEIRLWMIYVIAFLLGCVNSVDNPARQSFVYELVGMETLRNAVTLNSLETNLSRVIGPAIAGVLIVRIGLAPCFILNGLSFIAVLWSLWHMVGSELHSGVLVKARKGQIREGFAYVHKTPIIFAILVMMGIIGTFTYEFQVTLPLLAQFTFGGDAFSYAALMSSMGAGAAIGGLFIAGGHARMSLRGLTFATFGFAVAMFAVSASPTITMASLGMVAMGVFSIMFTSLCNSRLQIESAPTMRGRVMSFWSVSFQGSTLVGAPIIGLIGEDAGPRWGIFLGGVAALAATVFGLHVLRARRRTAYPVVK